MVEGHKIVEGNPEKYLNRILDERYSVDTVLEVGGMGTVYEGTHIRLGRKIAIKILHEELIADDVQTERFLREARAAAEIHHRNVVDVIDIGTTEEGLPYFVMELLKGEALKVRMKRLRIMAPSEIGWVMQQALAGLGVAHEHGVIHRDVKPGNVFISKERDGEEIAKILDFGVAKFKFRSEQIHAKELTTTGTILGTPYYMSPEQAMGKKSMVDARSDIYSCGLIVYRGLTGRNPFRGENYNEVIYNILTRDVPPPSTLNKNLEKAVDDVVLKAVARNPDERYQTCREFMAALEIFKDFKPPAEFLQEKRKLEEKGAAGTGPGEEDVESDSSQIMTEESSSEERAAAGGTGEEGSSSGGKHEASISHSQSVVAAGGRRGAVGFFLKGLLVLVLVLAGFYVAWLYREALFGPGGAAKKGSAEVLADSGAATKGTLTVPPDPPRILVTLKGLPEDAEVTVGGVVVADNPLSLKKASAPVHLEVRKDGLGTFVKDIVPQENLELEVALSPPAVEAEGVEKIEETGKPAGGENNGTVKKKKKKKKGEDSSKKIYTVLPGSGT
jgi:serine/threonine protein kinase